MTEAELGPTVQEVLDKERKEKGGLEYSDRCLFRDRGDVISGKTYTKFLDRENQGWASIHKKPGKSYRPLGVPLLDYKFRYQSSLSTNNDKQQNDHASTAPAAKHKYTPAVEPSNNPVAALLALCSPRRMETQEETRAIRNRVMLSNHRIRTVKAGALLTQSTTVQNEYASYHKISLQSPRGYQIELPSRIKSLPSPRNQPIQSPRAVTDQQTNQSPRAITWGGQSPHGDDTSTFLTASGRNTPTMPPSPCNPKKTPRKVMSKHDVHNMHEAEIHRIRTINRASPTAQWNVLTEKAQSKATQSAASLAYFTTKNSTPRGQILRQARSEIPSLEKEEEEEFDGEGKFDGMGRSSPSSAEKKEPTPPRKKKEKKNPVETLARCYANFDLAKTDLRERLFESLVLMDKERDDLLRRKIEHFHPRFEEPDDDLALMRADAEAARHTLIVDKHKTYAWLHVLVQHIDRQRNGQPTKEEVELMLTIGELMKERDLLTADLAGFRKVVQKMERDWLLNKEVRQLLGNLQKLFKLTSEEYSEVLGEIGFDVASNKFRRSNARKESTIGNGRNGSVINMVDSRRVSNIAASAVADGSRRSSTTSKSKNKDGNEDNLKVGEKDGGERGADKKSDKQTDKQDAKEEKPVGEEAEKDTEDSETGAKGKANKSEEPEARDTDKDKGVDKEDKEVEANADSDAE